MSYVVDVACLLHLLLEQFLRAVCPAVSVCPMSCWSSEYMSTNAVACREVPGS